VESVFDDEAVKGTEAAGGIVKEVLGERHLVDDVVVKWCVLECCVLSDVSWFVSALTSCAGYLYLCYAIEATLGGSSSLSLILASARMVFPF
jgi:hypothetical protein